MRQRRPVKAHARRRAHRRGSRRQPARFPAAVGAGHAPAVADEEVHAAVRGMFGRDSIYLFLSSAQMLLGGVLTPVLTRLLGTGEYGFVALAMSLSFVVSQLVNLGFPTGVQREYGDGSGRESARRFVLLAFATTGALSVLVAFGASGLTSVVAHVPAPVLELACLWGGSTAFTFIAMSLLRSEQRLGAFTLVSTLSSVGAQGGGLALILALGSSAGHYLLGVFVVQAAAAVAGLGLLLPRRLGLPARSSVLALMVFSLPLIPAQLSTFVLNAGDRFVIQHDLGATPVGRYAVAYNLGSWVLLLIGFVGQAWMPRIFAVRDERARWAVVARTRDQLDPLVAMACLGVAAAGPLVLDVWVPPSYQPGGLRLVLGLVAASAVPYAVFLNNVRVLNSLGRTGRGAFAAVLAAAANVGLNVALVPVIGIDGSALATLASYGVAAALSLAPGPVRRAIPPPPVVLQLGRAVALLAVVAVAVLPTGGWWLPGRLAASAVLAAWLLRDGVRAARGAK